MRGLTVVRSGMCLGQADAQHCRATYAVYELRHGCFGLEHCTWQSFSEGSHEVCRDRREAFASRLIGQSLSCLW